MTSQRDPAAAPSGLRGWLHGVGEVAGFARAGGWAVLELCLGRWPAPQIRRSRRPGEGPSDTIGPFPVHD